MVSIAGFRKMTASFEAVTEHPHFQKTAFKIKHKIFATLDEANGHIVVKLPAADQSVFCTVDPAIIYPVAGSWGKKGWTVAVLKKITAAMLKDLLTVSYCTVAPEKLRKKYQYNDQGY